MKSIMFWIGLISGGAIGAALGLLFALPGRGNPRGNIARCILSATPGHTSLARFRETPQQGQGHQAGNVTLGLKVERLEVSMFRDSAGTSPVTATFQIPKRRGRLLLRCFGTGRKPWTNGHSDPPTREPADFL